LNASATALAVALSLGAGACASRPGGEAPMRSIALANGSGGGRCLAVLLPGRWSGPEAFVRAGFAEAARLRQPALDLVAVDAHLGYYRDRSIVERLHQDVLEPARRSGATTIWLIGTSMGGTGALFTLRDRPAGLAGILLLAPFLGETEVIEAIEAAGGPQRWMPPLRPASPGEEIWTYLVGSARAPAAPIHLGWGARDRMARSNALLARLLPPERADRIDGAHDMRTWRALWERFLERVELCPR
jgi:pimeloyl-ACP methyl ester carboxylesterase